MSSKTGIPTSKIEAIEHYRSNDDFSDLEKVALEYAERITLTDQDVDDALFARLREHFSDEAIVELTARIAWENASSKFNRALRIESQGFYKP
ncbi:MAG: hypothetical protein CMJ77_16300 [Planctomycetaceae bacterium]|nr:hypothetical protein [Planctomycetaceae bacterium]